MWVITKYAEIMIYFETRRVSAQETLPTTFDKQQALICDSHC